MRSCELEKSLLEIFTAWRGLIKRRANSRPGSEERKRLDAIFIQALPVITRISEAPTNLDISIVWEIFKEENQLDFLESASGMVPGTTRKAQDG